MTPLTQCKCTMRQKLVGDGCPACNPEMGKQVELENDLDEHRTAFNVSADQLWLAARGGEDSDTLKRRLKTAENRLSDLQKIEKLAGRVC